MSYSDLADALLSRMSDVDIKISLKWILEYYFECKELVEQENASTHVKEQGFYWLGRSVKDECDSVERRLQK